MKINLYLLMLTFLFSSLNCKNNDFKTESYWIAIYSKHYRTYYTGDDGHPALVKKYDGHIIDTIKLKKVLSLSKDTMILTSFNETLYHGYREYKVKFDIDKDSIKFEYEDKESTIQYAFNDDRLLMLRYKNTDDLKYEDYFSQVEAFEMANKQKEISSFLINNPIILNKKTDNIEFLSPIWHHMGAFIQDSLEVNYGYGNDWYFYLLGKELFLIIGEKLIHISDFDNDKIYGYTYDNGIATIEITKSSYEKTFNAEYLIGKWIGRESLINKENIDRHQKIEISNENIIVTTNSFSDTLHWKLNKYKNKILIENDHYLRHGAYWKIQNLSKEQLILKRKLNDQHNSNIEVLILKRV